MFLNSFRKICDILCPQDNKDRLLLIIKTIVFFDFLGVSFIVPLIQSYYTDAEITGRLLGLLSSTFSIAQFFSGFIIGFLSDYPNKRDILLASLIGSVVSYMILGLSSNIILLFFSRIIVGLTKQTFTISNVIITEATSSSPGDRASHLGHINAAMTASFLVGPAIGAYLYQINKSIPLACSVICFCIGILITITLLPRTITLMTLSKTTSNEVSSKPKESTYQHMLHLAKSPAIQHLLVFRTALFFTEFAISSRSISKYYESKFSISTHSIGYMSSLSSAVSLLTQLFLIAPIMKILQLKESILIIIGLICYITLQLIEANTSSFQLFLIISHIPTIFISSIFNTILKSHFSSIIPVEDTGKALAVFNILMTGASIIAPLYGAEIFLLLKDNAVNYKSYVAALHYTIPLAIFLCAELYPIKKSIKHDRDVTESSESESSSLKFNCVTACKVDDKNDEDNDKKMK